MCERTSSTPDITFEAVSNILNNQKLFATEEIACEFANLLQCLQGYVIDLPPDQENVLSLLQSAIMKKDRKTLLNLGLEVLDILKDAWEESQAKFYDEVKLYFKFLHENGRPPDTAEIIALRLAPGKEVEYAAELDRLLHEGERSSIFTFETPDELKGENYADWVAQEGHKIIAKCHDNPDRITISLMVVEEGYSFKDAIAIAHWLVNNQLAPESAFSVSDLGPISTEFRVNEAKFCPNCGHPLPPIHTSEHSIICEECGFELKEEEG